MLLLKNLAGKELTYWNLEDVALILILVMLKLFLGNIKMYFSSLRWHKYLVF